jgi:hypothetical protein
VSDIDQWSACPPPNANPGNPWVVRDGHNTVIAIMGGFKSAGERTAKQIVADHALAAANARLTARLASMEAVLEGVASGAHAWHRLESLRLGGPVVEDWQDCTESPCTSAQEALRAEQPQDGAREAASE